MKTNYLRIKSYLEQTPRARERANKNRAVGNVILEQYSLEIDKGMMADIVGEVLCYDRMWRKVTLENPELRGSDYADKELLEQETIKDLYADLHAGRGEGQDHEQEGGEGEVPVQVHG